MKKVLYIPQISKIGATPSDVVQFHTKFTAFGCGFYPSVTGVQVVYSKPYQLNSSERGGKNKIK